MARPLRLDVSDGVYHVTSRGLERRAIVHDDRDRQRWTEFLDAAATRRNWRVFAWALMGNHYHLFLRVPHADLSAGMHDLNAGYVSWFNRRHRRNGPLFQGRFKAIIVEPGEHEWELTRYIHLNPVRAGLAARPETYPWSSCAFYFRERAAPPWLAWEEVLTRHGAARREARREYWRFLAEAMEKPPASPLSNAAAGAVLGSDGFVAKMRAWLSERMPDREVPAARRLAGRVEIKSVEDLVCAEYRVSREQLRRRGGHENEPRMAVLWLCRRFAGAKVAELAQRFGGVRGQAITYTLKQAERRRVEDEKFASHLAGLEDRVRQFLFFTT